MSQALHDSGMPPPTSLCSAAWHEYAQLCFWTCCRAAFLGQGKGVYKSDLAKVIGVDYSKGTAEVKLVPRIDYAEISKRQSEGGRGLPFGGHRAGKARPKAK